MTGKMPETNERPQRPEKLWLYPELTPCARYLSSDRQLIPLVVFIMLASAVPWEWLYSMGWYRAWIGVMGHWSPNIRVLPGSPSRIVELASAYLAFANALGPVYMAVVVRCGWRHGGHPELHERNRHIATWEIVKYFLIAVAMVFLMCYGVLWWGGGSSELYHTDLFYRSGPAFVTMHAVVWWWCGLMFQILVILVRMLGERWLGIRR